MLGFDYDFIVIGGGSAGVRAARMAAQNGKKVLLIEKSALGGTCVNVGCVPKKLYSYAASFAEDFALSREFGWQITNVPNFNWAQLRERTWTEIQRLNKIYQQLLLDSKVELLSALASLVDPHHVKVNDRIISAEKILLAVGARSKTLNFKGAEHMLGSDDVFTLDQLPPDIVIYGGGYIGVEFASILNALGVKVTLLYRGNLLLRGFDHEVREFIQTRFKVQGINLVLNQSITQIEPKNGQYVLHLSDSQKLQSSLILNATGRIPNLESLALENVDIRLTPKGLIHVDDRYQTNTPSILAIGDIIDGLQLTPIAIAQAMRLSAIHFENKTVDDIDYTLVPTAVFCHPNIATVGLTEEEAREQYQALRIYVSRFVPLRYAFAEHKENHQFLLKLVVDEASDRVIGAHMIGDDAGELIQGLAIAVKAGVSKAQFDSTIGIHPTVAEEVVTMRQITRR